MENDKKNVVSFFKTVQGEGRNGGQLVHFIRLYSDKCFPNRERCKFCDTVNREMYKEGMTFTELYGEIIKLNDDETPLHYVITGGEPFSYNPVVLVDMINQLITINVSKNLPAPKFDFETNGSFFNRDMLSDESLSGLFHMVMCTTNLINISPKLSNSYSKGNVKSMEEVYDFETLNSLYVYYKHFDFKFVVAVDDEEQMKSDLEEVLKFQDLAGISNENIWIMPMTPYENKKSLIALAEKVVELNFNFSNRLHVQIWGSDIVQEK